MPIAVATNVPPPLRSAPPPVAWRAWPLADGGWQVWLSVVTAAAIGGMVGWATARLDWALAATALVAVAFWPVFVPVSYELDALGITQQVLGYRRRFGWRTLHQVEVCAHGLFLSLDPGPLETFRGAYIPWGPHRDEVVASVEHYMRGSG